MSDLLLTAWVALMAADRIDLAGGHAAVMLTPFLVLTPLVLASESVRRHATQRPLRLGRPAVMYCALAGAFLAVSIASVLVAPDVVIGASRVFLLAGNITATLLVAVLIADRKGLGLILARGAIAWLVLNLVFDVPIALYWTGRMAESMRVGPVLLKFGDLQSLGFIPRLPGPVGDANHTGYMLLCDIVFIARGEPRAWLRRSALGVACVLLVATFSRSALLGVVGALIVTAFDARGSRALWPRALVVASVAAVVIAAAGLVAPRKVVRIADIALTPVSSRFSASEGSAHDHLLLIERGLDAATASIPRAFLGVGYGNSHMLLQDFFPGNKYGNFHSLYVSTFAESGIFALLLVMILLAVPAAASPPWRSLVVGSLAFNFFYQSATNPMFWLLLAFAWMAISWRPKSAESVALSPA